MHRAELTAAEQRVLGCLIEKRWTTPDQYPLSLNSLRLACNQATNRDPVTDYDEGTVLTAAQRLARYGLTRLATGHQSRATKYRHLAEEGLGLDRPQLAVLAVLLLRGPQTPGELKSRSERLAPATLTEVEQRLHELTERGFVRRLGHRPGQREDRFEHLLGGADASEPAPAPAPPPSPAPADTGPRADVAVVSAAPPPPPSDDPLVGRVSAVEAELRTQGAELAALREELRALRDELGA